MHIHIVHHVTAFDAALLLEWREVDGLDYIQSQPHITLLSILDNYKFFSPYWTQVTLMLSCKECPPGSPSALSRVIGRLISLMGVSLEWSVNGTEELGDRWMGRVGGSDAGFVFVQQPIPRDVDLLWEYYKTMRKNAGRGNAQCTCAVCPIDSCCRAVDDEQ